MSKTKHILTKVFYPIIIIATNIEVKNKLKDKRVSRLEASLYLVYGDENFRNDGVDYHQLRINYFVSFGTLKKKILKERYDIDWKGPKDNDPLPWEHRGKKGELLDAKCPECGHPLRRVWWSSCAESWWNMAGCAGWLTYCENCKKEIDFKSVKRN